MGSDLCVSCPGDFSSSELMNARSKSCLADSISQQSSSPPSSYSLPPSFIADKHVDGPFRGEHAIVKHIFTC